MTSLQRLSIALGLIICSVFAGCDANFRLPKLPGSAVVRRTCMQKIRANAKDVANFAYPSVEHQRVQMGSPVVYADGSFSVPAAFDGYWSSGNKTGRFVLEFNFEAQGKLLSMEIGDRTWTLPPFTEIEIGAAAGKAFANWMASDDEEARNDPTFQAAMKCSVRDVLIYLWNAS